MMREWDLVCSWNKFTLDTIILNKISAFSFWVYAGIWLPWPISQRDFVANARGVDLLDTAKRQIIFLVDSKGADAADASGKGLDNLPKKASSRERIDIKPSIITLSPMTEDSVNASVFFSVDPNMVKVPAWLVNFVLQVMVPWVYKMVLKIIKKRFANESSLYPQRMAKRRNLYAHFKSRIDQSMNPWAREEK
eukprot:CAMPEP_0197846460 /NCGR_PEP_ID=MMETSP1438-20131217/3195_1 /TAXON_ID=1461541 /ORGANISM="Pterosperma sp., Strain CCMP1384" /LENGTH=192 /DNA_ID=CAMNT_0043458117 /DNA_START=1 /DNA_END=579 /DNA_ORIENTATION=+